MAVTKIARQGSRLLRRGPFEILRLAWLLALCLGAAAGGDDGSASGPFSRQVRENTERLRSGSIHTRARGAEALGFLRAYAAEDALIKALGDPASVVRSRVTMALAWCGGRKSLRPLLAALEDPEWTIRQAAHVSLTNLTGMEFTFDAGASPEQRDRQIAAWSEWLERLPADRPHPEVLALLENARRPQRSVTASSTYKGPASVLVDGLIGPRYWQTKNVSPPQWCTIDLGREEVVAQVIVHQYGPRFVMTGYELATSLDGKRFEVVIRKREETPVALTIDFEPRRVRHLRIKSLGSKNPVYPTTFFEIQINKEPLAHASTFDARTWRIERGVRALGALGGDGATKRILDVIGPSPTAHESRRPMVRAAIRALGRLRNEAGFQALIALLEQPMWARYAADALGEFGDARAVRPLIATYARYAKRLNGRNPPDVPRDDKMGFPSEDRMLETPYWTAYALCRLPLDDPRNRDALRQVAPLVMANLPGDHDAMMLYEEEVGHLLTRHLMVVSDLRRAACEHAFQLLGQPRRTPPPSDPLAWPVFPAHRMSTWLPALCTQSQDLPRLIALLSHEDGWVRINAAKALAWIGDNRAIRPLAERLADAKAEAEFGYSPNFKDEEYNDPAPRWREAFIRALGLLGAREHAPLIARILDDERSVLEVRYAAAKALADLGGKVAVAALRRAACAHSFHSVRQVAWDALRSWGVEPEEPAPSRPPPATGRGPAEVSSGELQAIVFVKGSNSIPNTIGTVEQADRWRQTYVVTDSGPVYRPGRNLYILRMKPTPGRVEPLTRFEDGYVGDPELSWDGRQVLFDHRRQDDPWWHIYRINLDGSGLVQLTDGPYHDVGPAYLPDGRIVFASTRSGIRDEYHGYPCSALHVMHADGTGLKPIAINIGRDNEPAALHDGRIVFSRLEVFYSRNKTELTLHAASPDGTRDVVLYGPGRRQFWRDLDHGPRTPADGQESPLTHRVLRMTQPQPMPDGQRIVVVTQGGLALVGPRRDQESIISPDNKRRSYTTPFPLPDGRVLCASTRKVSDRSQVDLGLYVLDPRTHELKLIYNDPRSADFEPRPAIARRRPPVLPEQVDPRAYVGRFLCASIFETQEDEVRRRGRLIRLIEGMPVVGRHSTQTNAHEVWKNHGGTQARVLGTAPVAADGSFHVEVPADRLLHLQVLDSDRRVVGNQLTWIYARPGETKSCVGCHENPHHAPGASRAMAAHHAPLDFLPRGDEFSYRAKAWFKGHLPAPIEERTRTVRAVNLLGR